MSKSNLPTLHPQVEQQGEQLITTSLAIARDFDKSHDNVLRDIKNLECSDKFSRLNFEESTYYDERGKQQPMVIVTRDGFMLLCMGYTGKRMMQIKEAYIAAFSQMERVVIEQVPLLRQLVVQQNPDWKIIKRYRDMGLSVREVGLLLKRGRTYVEGQIKAMEACGYLVPSAKVLALRDNAYRNLNTSKVTA